MLLDDERHVIKWLSQYGALTKTQVIRLLRDKTPETAEKILRNLKREHQISDVAGGYYLALDGLCKPDQRTILAVWVLLRFIDYVDPMAHYPAVYPSQIFFLKENTGYEIVVLYDGEQHLSKLLQPQDDEMKYIFVLPNIAMASQKPLSGAVMGLFAASETRFTKDTALLTAVSAEDGRFRFEKIPAGNWLVREIEQPKGFVLSEELFPVTVKEQGQVIEIKIANKLIRGSVTLTKYDADYPENKLSGAVFEVYRDVNGNKALDKDDVLLGTMEESSAGVYWMKNLEYGGVLVREKTAPEGFIPDEKAYYVEIDTDGKTYTVENEAGKGFINRALKGSLKIIKTTSDGKKEGFAFRITGANGYDMTFTTDSKGEIFIEKLRIGEYTVTELKNSASEGYKIADPVKITLVANETLTVKIHNDKTKVDVPKTGDDADLMLWISLLGLAAAGVGCTAFFYLKKRRTGKHIAAKK